MIRSVSLLRITVTACLLALLAAWLTMVARGFHRSTYYLEATINSPTASVAEVFFDVGEGFNAGDRDSLLLEPGSPQHLAFPLPSKVIKGLRLDPISCPGSAVISNVRLVEQPTGRVVRTFERGDMQPQSDVAEVTPQADGIRMVTRPGGDDPAFIFRLDRPIVLTNNYARVLRVLARYSVEILLVLWPLLWLIEKALASPRILGRYADAITAWLRGHPQAAICLAGALAAVASCYPVVFFGRSFVSPNNGPTLLLYDHLPTVPGSTNQESEDVRGADTGAIMWAFAPYSAVEHRALAAGELPLWNRYNSSGVTLVGQGLTMFGDPLHMLPVLTGGSAWAWDAKFVLAKVLFACGIGLLVYHATRHAGVSAVLAAASVFMGFFSYRFNHPAIFTACYAPWILLCWLRVAGASTTLRSALWAQLLVVAEMAVLRSGTVKEASIAMVMLNSVGVIAFLQTWGTMKRPWLRLGQVAAALLLFAAIASPMLLTFASSFRIAFTTSEGQKLLQYHPSYFASFFDDILYRWKDTGGGIASTNVVVLLGVLWSLVHLRTLLANRHFVVTLTGALLCIAIIYGGIPEVVLDRIPLLRSMVHIANCFTVALFSLVFIVAGFGLRALCDRLSAPLAEQRRDWYMAMIFLAGLLLFYFGATQEWPRSAFFLEYVFAALICLMLTPAVLWLAVVRRVRFATPVLVAFFVVVTWRHGMHLATGFDDYVMNPQPRVELRAHSPAVEYVHDHTRTEPARVKAVGGGAHSGYLDTLALEGIDGPDPIMNQWYHQLAKDSGLLAEWGWHFQTTREGLASRRRLCDMLNVKYYMGKEPAGPAMRPVVREDIAVYASDTAWPRAFFVDRVGSYDGIPDFLKMLDQSDGRPFAATQREQNQGIPPAPPTVADPARTIVAATNYRLTANNTSFDIDAPAPGMIVLTETYLPGAFRLTVNGRPAEYVRVNHAFRGVVVDAPGHYHIAFGYWPRHLTAALWVCGGGMALLIGWTAATCWRLRTSRRSVAAAKSGMPISAAAVG